MQKLFPVDNKVRLPIFITIIKTGPFDYFESGPVSLLRPAKGLKPGGRRTSPGKLARECPERTHFIPISRRPPGFIR